MDFFSRRGKQDAKTSGLFGKKSVSKSNPGTPPHPSAATPSNLSYERAETDYDFHIPDEQRPHRKQPASERVPNSQQRPPIHGYGTPERPRKSTEHRSDRMYEADTRSNASPFHPFKSPSPSPYHKHGRHRDHYEEMYEPEVNTIPHKSGSASPFHPAGSLFRTPLQYRTPDRPSEDLYEADGDVTPRNRSPPSPFHPAASRSPPQAYRRPDRLGNQYGNEQLEGEMYEPYGDDVPRSPVHGVEPQYYPSSDDDDKQSTYLYPEIATPSRAMPVSANSTPVHQNYQMVVAETYEQDDQFEPPELPDESQSFTVQEMANMRGLKSEETGTEEIQSMISEAYVSVANYRVRQSVSETLQAILDKHGDIGAASKLQSMATRSYYLESLATVVMELRSTVLRDLTKTRVGEMAAVVKDMESVKIDVSWLKKAVGELEEAVEYYGQYEAAKREKEVCERDMKARKGKMEEMTGQLRKREEEIRECREKVTVVASKLGQLEMKGSRLNKNLELYQSKVGKFEGEAVLLHV